MLRRSHKKSKKGCVQCLTSKRRHVKCDEGRPTCLLCKMSNRDCSFASDPQQPQDTNSLTSDPSSREGSLLSPDTNLRSTSATSLSDSHESSFDSVVNMEHMELFIHGITNKDLFSLGDRFEHSQETLNICLEESVKAPYLLHQVLAFSARHLAAIHPERSARYLDQAVKLQTRAVSLFNSTRREVNSSNCLPILLFSVTLGHHLLADALATRTSDGLDGFLTHYVQCVEMNRGLYRLTLSAWPLLLNTELEPVLSWSSQQSSKDPVGSHCEPIVQLIKDSTALSNEEKEVCREAIQYLQLGFDGIEEDVASRYRMIFQWTMLASPELTSLLATKRPEALILLGYYALLLHHGRKLWQVGDTGVYLLGLISDYLAPEWHIWLEYPRRMTRQK
ncbi:sterol regulatory element-binding ECM22 [Fusarium tjaetaba]|uniref:Sterol regulatory element-binding ECM22 n=1 Tax=Fusarium tjaetaba TaxID=1567544 RepID=A0A8H5SBF1_9HYPO|nr:sterol regulatory element-binding ECM22 [Fusarium tjaetaba]KAF5647647.1 sterol regulatory element-binding ECM22 [Fusarium tjaetaba]